MIENLENQSVDLFSLSEDELNSLDDPGELLESGDSEEQIRQNYEDLHSIGSLDPTATADADSGSTVSDSAA